MMTFRLNKTEKKEAKELLEDIRLEERYKYPEILLQALRVRKSVKGRGL
jgi:hypothetical protein